MVASAVMVPVLFLEQPSTSESLPFDQDTSNDIQNQHNDSRVQNTPESFPFDQATSNDIQNQRNDCRVQNGADHTASTLTGTSPGCMSKSYTASNVQLQAVIECSLGQHKVCDLQHSEAQFHSDGNGSVVSTLTNSQSHALLLLSKVSLR